jgi:hypothetical protein
MRSNFAVIVMVGAAVPAMAQHAGDIALTVENGRIVTNEQASPGMLTRSRVFRSEFGVLGDHFTQDPGFDCLPGTFPTPGAIGFRIRGPVLRWNGAGLDGSDPASFSIAFASLGPTFSPLCNTVVDGFTINIGSNGQWHRHLEFIHEAPSQPGIYVLELELFTTTAQIGSSRPFWIVFNEEFGEADHTEAVEWVVENLVPQRCSADFDRDGTVGVPDIFSFLSVWFAGPATADGWRADFDGSCSIGVPDIFSFLAAWFAGCP